MQEPQVTNKIPLPQERFISVSSAATSDGEFKSRRPRRKHRDNKHWKIQKSSNDLRGNGRLISRSTSIFDAESSQEASKFSSFDSSSRTLSKGFDSDKEMRHALRRKKYLQVAHPVSHRFRKVADYHTPRVADTLVKRQWSVSN